MDANPVTAIAMFYSIPSLLTVNPPDAPSRTQRLWRCEPTLPRQGLPGCHDGQSCHKGRVVTRTRTYMRSPVIAKKDA